MKRFWISSFFALLVLPSCSHVRNYDALPKELESQVCMPGIKNARAWGDQPSPMLESNAIESIKQELEANNGKLAPVMNALALSGGGGDGAFGAGLLCGWTETGTRPSFKVVTGISTGALISSFAFLGSEYDAKLKAAYTTISDKDIYKEHSLIAIVLSLINIRELPSLASDAALIKTLKKLIDDEMIDAIAKEHAKGRRLIVGTTQLDAQRLVLWDMGAIASMGTKESYDLFRRILVASASLPATFPPQFFDVEAAGKRYTEMHVDGGVEAQVMLFENALFPFSRISHETKTIDRPRKLYIIRNKKVYPQWDHTPPQLKYIAARTIDSLLKSQSIGDLYRLYTYAQRDEMEFNLAFIPNDFTAIAKSEFDTEYMNKLFTFAHEIASKGYPWATCPPDYTP